MSAEAGLAVLVFAVVTLMLLGLLLCHAHPNHLFMLRLIEALSRAGYSALIAGPRNRPGGRIVQLHSSNSAQQEQRRAFPEHRVKAAN